MKLFAKDDSERGDGQSDDSDLFSSSDDDDDDFIDKAKTPSPVIELPRSPSPTRVQDGYDSDDEAEPRNGLEIAEIRGEDTHDELDNKIMELIERSVKSPDYHAGKEAAESLGSRIKDTIQESLKNEPIATSNDDRSNGHEDRRADDANSPLVKSPSPEPPAVTLNESTVDMTKQIVPERQLPKDLSIRPRKSPPSSPKKTPTRSTPPSPRKSNDRLSAPLNQAAFPPSPTRFIRKSGAQEAKLAASQKRPRPPSSNTSSDTIVSQMTEKDVKRLPAYTGNERSRYGLPLEEKAKLRETRDKVKREKEEKARLEEEAKLQRKIDAQKTFEAWLKNKESEKKGSSSKKKALSPQSNDENSQDFITSPNTTVTFLTWLEGKNIQEKRNKLQQRLRQIELEELGKKHTRQDAQQAYRRWLRKKALETEQQRMIEKQKKVEEKLSSSSIKSRETLDSFFQSEHFHSLEHQTSNGKC
ncbi:swi5-dependent recombination DNA repair protein 1 homolog [Galendromus occidentalis]|uniref:Coiled-coil domain-containing protein 181 n=1 Tax=Galendromus occidentalis TaxID=34638 RepID=A0AAJ7WHR4_9ACAR|nr:swi5-dependent recombination DNA repair protein 1 homolog [Galendromus occidentalis]